MHSIDSSIRSGGAGIGRESGAAIPCDLTSLAAQREHGFCGVPALTDAVGKRWCERRPRILRDKEVLNRNVACRPTEAIAAAILD